MTAIMNTGLSSIGRIAGQVARWSGSLVAIFALVAVWRPAEANAATTTGSVDATTDIGDVSFAAVGDVDVDEGGEGTYE